MADRSGIEWTDSTWNPVTGCDRISPGCDHCYAQTLAARLKAMGNPRYQSDGSPRTSGPGFGLTLHEDQLGLPLRWRRPRMIFVNSMSDLFHPDVPEEFIERVLFTVSQTPQHIYQVLTKRPRRMAHVLSEWIREPERRLVQLPLANLWLGVSVEDQKWADQRIPLLMETPARVRFISCEPLLGPVDLGKWTSDVDWVIVGGESGPKARPMHIDWARAIRNECVDAGVPFFFKQWGGRTPKSGGRLLDGRTWDMWPRSTVISSTAASS